MAGEETAVAVGMGTGSRTWWVDRMIRSSLEVHIDKIEFRTILRESHTFVIDMNPTVDI